MAENEGNTDANKTLGWGMETMCPRRKFNGS